jgi:hypothetical protein
MNQFFRPFSDLLIVPPENKKFEFPISSEYDSQVRTVHEQAYMPFKSLL